MSNEININFDAKYRPNSVEPLMPNELNHVWQKGSIMIKLYAGNSKQSISYQTTFYQRREKKIYKPVCSVLYMRARWLIYQANIYYTYIFIY